MSFEVQRCDQDTPGGARYTLLRAYMGTSGVFNPYGLRWELAERRRSDPFPGVKVVYAVFVGGMTEAEAEEATGLYAPACWDKILEEV